MDVVNKLKLKAKKRIGRTPLYTPEYYMLMAKEVVDEGLSYRKAGDKYKCSHGTVSHWVKLYREGRLPKRIESERKQRSKAQVQVELQERYIKELKVEIGQLYLENQLLKKAQTHILRQRSASLSVITSENLDQYQEDAES